MWTFTDRPLDLLHQDSMPDQGVKQVFVAGEGPFKALPGTWPTGLADQAFDIISTSLYIEGLNRAGIY